MALWTPALRSTGFWFDTATPAARVLDGSSIVQLLDRSGNEIHISAAGSHRPARVVAEKNGLDIARFSGGQILRSAPVQWHDGPWTVIAVAKRNDTSGTQMLVAQDLSHSSPAVRIAQYLTPVSATPHTVAFNSAGSAFIANKSGTVTNWLIWSSVYSGADLKMYIDGVAGTSVVTTGTPKTGSIPLCIGGRERSSPTNLDNLLVGDIGEIVGIPGVLPQAEFDQIIGYLAHRWGTTAGLDASHPYKTVAPTAQAFSLYGTTRDKSGILAPRTIQVIRETPTVEYLGEFASDEAGAYTIPVPTDDPCTLVFSGEPDRNAQVFSGVIPG